MCGVCEGTPLVKNSMFFSFFLLPPPPLLLPPSLSSPPPPPSSPPLPPHCIQCKGDSLAYQESLEHFLIVWVNLLETGQNTKTFPHHLLSQSCVTILGAYIQSKLSAPRGWRTIQKDEDEIFEIDEDDRVTFADQLYSVAEIAQSNLGHSLPLLISLLERSTTECLELLSAIQQDHQVLCNGQNNLDSLYEDLHWLTLISCFTLCNASDDIPLKIMAHSISLQKFCLSEMANLDIRRLVLQDGGEKIDLRTLKLDSVVVLVVLVCRLCVMEKMFVESGLLEVLSPQLCETVLWCLSEIVQPYIMLDEDDSIHEQVRSHCGSVLLPHSTCLSFLSPLLSLLPLLFTMACVHTSVVMVTDNDYS